MDVFRGIVRILPCLFDECANVGRSFLCKAKGQLLSKMRLSSKAKILMSFILILSYVYLLVRSSDWSGDHVEIGCIHVLVVLPTVQFLFSMYAKLFFVELFRGLALYGWFRIVLYILFLFAFSYAFVAVVLDRSALFCMDRATDVFVSRFEGNIMIFEDRTEVERIVPRPLEQGPHLFQLFRYPMEDVQMNCTAHIWGFPGGKPFLNQAEWRYNGVPLTTMTDRHSHVTEFTELPKDHPLYFSKTVFGELGLSIYEVRSTLSIHLLEETEFGSYTCHMHGKVHISLTPDEWKSKTGQSPPNTNKTENKGNAKPKEKSKVKPSGSQCTCDPERKYLFQDANTLIGAFRLIMMQEKQDQIVAPPSSILVVETSYWHLSSDDDVQADYTVNEVSYPDLCSDGAFNGCSALQRLLSYIIAYDRQQAWWFLETLPFLQRFRSNLVGQRFVFGQCLCENSFGRHNVKYLRRYYNRTSEQYEPIEITHPQTLLVRPPKQNATSFFANFFNPDPIQLLPLTDYLPDYAYDLTLIKDLAVLSALFLNLKDAFVLIFGVVICVYILYKTHQLLGLVGFVSKRLCLEGSMGYLYTAKRTARLLIQNGADDSEHFDVYLSHSDSKRALETVTAIVLPLFEGQLGLKACFRERDIPPGEPELASLSRAIEKSKRFIIFLSKDFLEDGCREMETAAIMESLWDRSSKPEEVLVIKLDDCEMPGHWKDFTVHNWTSSNLHIDDHLRRLVQWVTPQAERNGEMRSVLDVFVTWLPCLVLLLVFLVLLVFR